MSQWTVLTLHQNPLESEQTDKPLRAQQFITESHLETADQTGPVIPHPSVCITDDFATLRVYGWRKTQNGMKSSWWCALYNHTIKSGIMEIPCPDKRRTAKAVQWWMWTCGTGLWHYSLALPQRHCRHNTQFDHVALRILQNTYMVHPNHICI